MAWSTIDSAPKTRQIWLGVASPQAKVALGQWHAEQGRWSVNARGDAGYWGEQPKPTFWQERTVSTLEAAPPHP